jgi:hypothetical protein
VTHLVLAVAMLLAHGAPATADEGFLERDNSTTIDLSDDWGMFLSYQFLPWAEFIVDGGKFQFVRARLLFSIPLETS